MSLTELLINKVEYLILLSRVMNDNENKFNFNEKWTRIKTYL